MKSKANLEPIMYVIDWTQEWEDFLTKRGVRWGVGDADVIVMYVTPHDERRSDDVFADLVRDFYKQA